MSVLAMFLFFALGIMALAMFVERILDAAEELRAVVLVGLAVGLAWAVDFSLPAGLIVEVSQPGREVPGVRRGIGGGGRAARC